jgi:hypothetical protein
MMIVGTLLIVFGFALVVMPLLIAFGILPQLSGSAFGAEGEVGGAATRDIPTTSRAVRVQALRFSAVVGVLSIAVGVALIVIDAQHNYKVEDAILANRQNITEIVSQPPATATTVRTVVAGTPTSGPVATPVINTNAGRDRFNQALALDKAGNNIEAIAQYKLAIASGLDSKSREAAQLEIGLLSLLLVKDGNRQACADAKTNLAGLTGASTSSTRQYANDALKETAKLCG